MLILRVMAIQLLIEMPISSLITLMLKQIMSLVLIKMSVILMLIALPATRFIHLSL